MRINSRKYEKFIAPALFLSLGFHLLAAFVPQGAVDFLYGTRETPPLAVRFEVVPLAPEPAPVYRPLEPESSPSTPEPAGAAAKPEPVIEGTKGDSAESVALAAPKPPGLKEKAPAESAPPAVAEFSLEPDSSAVIGAYIEAIYSRIIRTRYYPEICRRLGQEGEVVVGFAISREGGLAGQANLIGPSPFAPLNLAACRSIERCAPFPPLPDCVHDNYLALKVKILYKLQ